jgi:NAD(P)H-dependent flavin oxidoreductase YrpB (nitropropane dioxygenase family)
MRTALCKRLGIEVPIFAFSHCRDVVVEVTKAGGFGVLGAATFSAEQLEAELRWIDTHVGGRPYGIDVIIPSTYDAKAERAAGDLDKLIPAEHKAFMDKLLDDEGVPPLPDGERERMHREIVEGRGSMTPQGARKLVQTALNHPQVKLIVSALGPPPPDVVSELKARGVTVGAMCGKASHTARHRAAGVEVIIAQGTEAGGHTGDIATMVLVPQVVEAVNGEIAVLAAGGITKGSQIAAALAMGAQGVWCGTLWLGTIESELDPFEKSAVFAARAEDAVRRKARTGKTVRMIRSKMSEAWEQPGAPAYLPTPLQGVLFNDSHARVVRAKRADLYSFPVGQSVCDVNAETTVREVMVRLQTEYLNAMERLVALHNQQAEA